MNTKAFHVFRIPSLVLAAALQVMPVVRAALPAAESAASVLAIIFRWVAGAAASLGAVDAVSGASTVITSPLTAGAVQGQPFTMRLTTAPNQAAYWTATGLPAGLSLSGQNGSSFWQIVGTPTVTGTFNVGLTGYEQQGSRNSTSSTLVLTVSTAVPRPVITGPPVSQTVTQGQSATFSVTATGSGTLSYQWQFQSANLSGQTGSNLVINPATAANAGSYDVIVSNSGGSVTSVVATLTVIVPPTPPTITTSPASLTVAQGQSATFSVSASGTPPLSYQWRFNSAGLSGQTASNLVLNPVSTNQAGNYDVMVSNTSGSVTSAVATLTVTLTANVPPNITTPPASLTVTQGQSATFTVVATGSAPLSYYWRKGTTVVAGPIGSSYTIANVQTGNAGSYSVIVSNSAGTATSTSATLTVALPVPFIITPPVSQAVLSGFPATFTVVAGGATPLRYQWYFNNAPLAGQTAASLTLASVQAANLGPYYVIVSNQRGSITSPVAQLSLVQTKGTYSGLYYDPNPFSILSSGSFTATATDSGKFTASLMLLGIKYSLSGQFDASGRATNLVKRGTLKTLTVELAIDLSGADQIRGRVTDGTWSAPLLAYRAVWNQTANPAPQAGTYTLVIPGMPGATQSPAGDGFGTLKVNAAGQVQFSGLLADGTKLTQTATISKSGDWPFCSSLYGREGSILGWLAFTNRTSDDLSGWVTWTRMIQPSTPPYPFGFAFQSDPVGSKYAPPPSGTPVVTFSNGSVTLTDGNLVQGISIPVLLGANNKISSLGDNPFTLSLSPSSGLLTGTVPDPATGRGIPVKGVALQKQNLARGFFLNSNLSGTVYVGP